MDRRVYPVNERVDAAPGDIGHRSSTVGFLFGEDHDDKMTLSEVIDDHFLEKYSVSMQDAAFDELEHAHEDGTEIPYEVALSAWQIAIERQDRLLAASTYSINFKVTLKNLIEVDGLVRELGDKGARRADVSAPPGQITGFLGPNGADDHHRARPVDPAASH